jgi:hypothetical protein
MVLLRESTRIDPQPFALARTLDRAARVLLAGLTLVCCVGVFVGLGRSSFWLDELWTVRMLRAGPRVWDLILLDVHPPFYYAAAGLWARLFGDGETALRALSALCMVSALAVLWRGTARALSPAARLVLVAAASSSALFFQFAREARMYGLAVLLCALVLTAALELTRAGGERGRSDRALLVLFAAGLFGALTHFYLFVGVGLTFAWLLVTVRDGYARLLLTLGGAVILAVELAFVGAVVSRPGIVHQPLWFSAEPAFIRETTLYFVRLAAAPLLGAAALLLAAVALLALAKGRPPATDATAPDVRLGDLGLALWVPVGTWVVGVATTVLFVPNFSGRNLVVLAPMLWFALAWLFDFVRARSGEATRAAVLAGTALLLLPGASLLRWTGQPTREPWRESARYVAGLAGCRAAALPAASPNAAGLFPYRHYLPADAAGRVSLVARDALARGGSPEWTRQALARARGDDTCPVLLWSVRAVSPERVRALGAALAVRPDFPRDREIRVREFAHVEPGLRGRREVAAVVLEVAPKGARP